LIHPHFLFEAAAYFVGFRLFLWQRYRIQGTGIAEGEDGLWLAVGAILGAALGSKLLAWGQDPEATFAGFPDFVALMQGKTVVGGFLGGLIGVEIAKNRLGYNQSTGDLFVYPCLVGIIIGRIGCFLTGLPDRTHGIASSLPWAWDFGDGIGRHPTQLYEIVFAIIILILIVHIRRWLPLAGDQFKCFMLAYLTFRLVVDYIKPSPYLYFGILSGIQLACIAGLVYYAKDGIRIGKSLVWQEK